MRCKVLLLIMIALYNHLGHVKRTRFFCEASTHTDSGHDTDTRQ